MATDDVRGNWVPEKYRSVLARLFVLIAVLVPVMILTTASHVYSAETAETTSAAIWLDGPSQAAQGETISYDIRTDAAGLFGLQFDILFDPAVIQGVGTELTPGSCPAPDFVVTNLIDNSSGTISYAASALAPSQPCDGGIVASVQFQVSPTAAGESTSLQFANVILADAEGAEIPSTPTDLSLEISEEVVVAANFSGTPTSGPAPLAVSFTNLSSGLYDTCSWDFGDGSSSTSCLNQNHTYVSTGSFTVSLTVSGAGSSDSESKANYIVVTEPKEEYIVYAPVVLSDYP